MSYFLLCVKFLELMLQSGILLCNVNKGLLKLVELGVVELGLLQAMG